MPVTCPIGRSTERTDGHLRTDPDGRPPAVEQVVAIIPTIFQAAYAPRPAAAANGSNRIVLMCPRSPDINALTCLDDLY